MLMRKPRPAISETSELPSGYIIWRGLVGAHLGHRRQCWSCMRARCRLRFRTNCLCQQSGLTECSLPRSNKSATGSRDRTSGSGLSPCIVNPFSNHDSPFLTLQTCSQGHGRTDVVVSLQRCLVKTPKTLTTLPLSEVQSRLHDLIFRIERLPEDQGLWQ